MVIIIKSFSHTKEAAYLLVICKSAQFDFNSFLEELHFLSRELIIVCTSNPLLFTISWKKIYLFFISWTCIKVEKIWISKFTTLHIWKWQTHGLKCVLLQVCGEKLIYTESHQLILKEQKSNIINTKHKTGDKQIREKWKLTLSWQ